MDILISKTLMLICTTLFLVLMSRFIYKGKIAGFNFILMAIISAVSVTLANVNDALGQEHAIWTGPVALGVLFLLLWWFNKRITKPLHSLTAIVKRLADGDFSIEFDVTTKKKDDEIGIISTELERMLNSLKESVALSKMISEGKIYEAKLAAQITSTGGDLDGSIENMISTLQHVTSAIGDTANGIATGSNEISASAQTIANGSSEQASATEQMMASVEELRTIVTQNAENAQQAKQVAALAAQSINDGVQASVTSFAAVEKITEKIQVINKIAERIGILAINASIEAARAGQNGKGFSAVAQEVRRLADESNRSANEIILLSVENLEIVRESGEQLSDAVPNVERTAKLIDEIAYASAEQESGLQQVQEAINELNEVTLQNSSTAEQLATGSEELASQAQILNDSVAFFVTEETNDIDSEIVDIEEKMEQMLETLKELRGKKKQSSITVRNTPNTVHDNNHSENVDKRKIQLDMESNPEKDDEFMRF